MGTWQNVKFSKDRTTVTEFRSGISSPTILTIEFMVYLGYPHKMSWKCHKNFHPLKWIFTPKVWKGISSVSTDQTRWKRCTVVTTPMSAIGDGNPPRTPVVQQSHRKNIRKLKSRRIWTPKQDIKWTFTGELSVTTKESVLYVSTNEVEVTGTWETWRTGGEIFDVGRTEGIWNTRTKRI